MSIVRVSCAKQYMASVDATSSTRRITRLRRSCLALPSKCKQIRVDVILQGDRESVWRAVVEFQGRTLDYLRGHHCGCTDRDDLIVSAVNDQRRNVKLLQVFRKVGFRK